MDTVIRRGKRQSEQRPPQPSRAPGGMEAQEGMPHPRPHKGRDQAQRGAESMSSGSSQTQ